MKALKLFKATNNRRLFFATQNYLHVGKLKAYQMQNFSMKISFSMGTKGKNNDFDKLCNKPDEIIVETSVAEENLYEPKESLKFIDGVCKIYENQGFKAARLTIYLVAFVLSFVIYKSLRRIQRHYHNGKWFRIIFYIMLIYGVSFFLRALTKFEMVVKRIDLCQDGKNVLVVYPKNVFFLTQQKINISTIQRPVKVDNESKGLMEYGYPILIENKLRTLARHGRIHNKELLPVILNGKYINTKNDQFI